MKQDELFQAIGGLDEEMLAETEEETGRKGRRLGVRVVLVAALLAGLGVSAVATPLIRNALKNGSLETNSLAAYTPTNPDNGHSYEIRTHEIRVEIALDETAPEYIETFYIPKIPEGYPQHYGGLYNQGSLLHCVWSMEGSCDQDITFWQTARYSYDPDEIVAIISTPPGDQPLAEMRTYADREGYYVQQKPVAELPGKHIFFWSDGSYLYRLELPCEYTDPQIEEIIASVATVSDINAYLMSAE